MKQPRDSFAHYLALFAVSAGALTAKDAKGFAKERKGKELTTTAVLRP